MEEIDESESFWRMNLRKGMRNYDEVNSFKAIKIAIASSDKSVSGHMVK